MEIARVSGYACGIAVENSLGFFGDAVEYDPDFARSFMRRTLELAKSYDGPHDATLLVNCLLGLLIVPKESLIAKIPPVEFEHIAEWGIRPDLIKDLGKCEYGHEHRLNLRQLVRRLRNAVAHFRIEPRQRGGSVLGYSFRDQNGFRAEVSLAEIKDFVSKLAAHLESNA